MRLVIGNQPEKDPERARCQQLLSSYSKLSDGLSREEVAAIYQGLIYDNPRDPAEDLKEFFKWFGILSGAGAVLYILVCYLLIALSH